LADLGGSTAKWLGKARPAERTTATIENFSAPAAAYARTIPARSPAPICHQFSRALASAAAA